MMFPGGAPPGDHQETPPLPSLPSPSLSPPSLPPWALLQPNSFYSSTLSALAPPFTIDHVSPMPSLALQLPPHPPDSLLFPDFPTSRLLPHNDVAESLASWFGSANPCDPNSGPLAQSLVGTYGPIFNSEFAAPSRTGSAADVEPYFAHYYPDSQRWALDDLFGSSSAYCKLNAALLIKPVDEEAKRVKRTNEMPLTEVTEPPFSCKVPSFQEADLLPSGSVSAPPGHSYYAHYHNVSELQAVNDSFGTSSAHAELGPAQCNKLSHEEIGKVKHADGVTRMGPNSSHTPSFQEGSSSAPLKRMEELVKLIHGSSVELLSTNSSESKELKPHDYKLLSAAINNIALILKDKEDIIGFRHCSSVRIACSCNKCLKTGELKRNNNIHNCNVKGKTLSGCNFSNDEFDNFVVKGGDADLSKVDKKMTQTIETALSQSFTEAEESRQASLYKNLWIQAEALACRLKQELLIAQMKTESESYKPPRSDISSCLHSPRDLKVQDSPSKPKDIEGITEQESQFSASANHESSKAEDVESSIMARFKILKDRDNNSVYCNTEADYILDQEDAARHTGYVDARQMLPGPLNGSLIHSYMTHKQGSWPSTTEDVVHKQGSWPFEWEHVMREDESTHWPLLNDEDSHE